MMATPLPTVSNFPGAVQQSAGINGTYFTSADGDADGSLSNGEPIRTLKPNGRSHALPNGLRVDVQSPVCNIGQPDTELQEFDTDRRQPASSGDTRQYHD